MESQLLIVQMPLLLEQRGARHHFSRKLMPSGALMPS